VAHWTSLLKQVSNQDAPWHKAADLIFMKDPG